MISSEKQVCAHLLALPDSDYVRVFTGEERVYHLVCPACGKTENLETIPWRVVDNGSFTRIEFDGICEGVRGAPEVRSVDAPLAFVHHPVAVPGSVALRLVQPVYQPVEGHHFWIGLTASGSLIRMDLADGVQRHITDISSSDLDLSKHVSLTCSPSGDYICLTETLGDAGVVIACDSGDRTMRLQRDGYCSDVSPFPATFVAWEERTLLVHATTWNRLDVSDPATGHCLTERYVPSYQKGSNPPRYLDYFHGRLLIAPNHDFIADDGWVWHPRGEIRTWSVRRWLETDPWESEDGGSVKELASRYYFWGGPLCWIDKRTLVVWGYGEDDDWLLPAVRIFDVVTGVEQGWFAGPEVSANENKKGMDALMESGGRLFFDRYLFAISERFGTSVWDVETGTRLHQAPSFLPSAYHPETQEFLTILPNGELQLSRLVNQ